jgi:hypothetical protein
MATWGVVGACLSWKDLKTRLTPDWGGQLDHNPAFFSFLVTKLLDLFVSSLLPA